jgi:hypothetical protein
MNINSLTLDELHGVANLELRWATGNYGNELVIKLDDARSGSHTGQCDSDVQALSEAPYIKQQLDALDPKKLRDELREYGAWDSVELEDHEANKQRWLWSACSDIVERNEED